MERLLRLKIRLNKQDNSQDELLRLLLDEAENYILGYTKRRKSDWLPCFNSIQTQIAVINYTRLGLEGVSGRSEGDISTTFLGVTDYPDSITKALNPYRLIRGLEMG